MGEKPTGYASFLPEGRVFFVLTGEARKPAKTDQEKAELLGTLVAYTGTYSLEGDKWTTNVEVAWNPNRSEANKSARSSWTAIGCSC